MTAAHRIGVLIAGNVYLKRALVRRFLEDGGYEVVGDVMTGEAVLPAIRAGRPHAVLLDEDLTHSGIGIAEIREAAPDVRVVVFTAIVPGEGLAPPPGADGYLDKGVGLTTLTALLGRLFVEPTEPLEPLLVGGGAGVVAAETSEGTMEDTRQMQPAPTGKPRGGSGGNAYRLVAMAAGVLLIAWGVFTAIDANREGGDSETVAKGATVPTDDGDTIIAEPTETTTALDDAYAALDRVVTALEGSNYILATVEAQVLMDQRDQALLAGFATVGLDAEVTARLEGLVSGLPERVNVQLADILGSLYPAFEAPTKPGGGSDVVLGTTVTNDGGGTTGGDTTGGDTTGGGGGGDGGGGQEETEPQPGDGRDWGQSHKPPHGGWHGQKPK